MAREVDMKILALQNDDQQLDAFIVEHEFFIRSCHRHWKNRTLTEVHPGTLDTATAEDTWSIALSAFHEAIRTYDFQRGSFYSFAALVIDRRLIDFYRHEKKHFREIPVNPFVFESSADQDEALSDQRIRIEVSRKLSVEPDTALALEIEAANQMFSAYGFSFFDLAECSPKAEKTRQACAKAVACLIQNPALYFEMNHLQQLPIKRIEMLTGIPRKIIERHRKFIIAATEIFRGDYPHLAHYMRYIKEEISR